MPTEPRPIFHLEIPSVDTAKTAHFYEQLFGWTHGDVDAPYTYFQAGALSGGYPRIGGGLAAVTAHFKPGDVVVYVRSDDLAADLQRVVELGGSVLLQPTAVDERYRVALMADPNGAKVMLSQGQ